MNFDTQLCTEIGEWFDEEHKGLAETLTRFHERNQLTNWTKYQKSDAKMVRESREATRGKMTKMSQKYK